MTTIKCQSLQEIRDNIDRLDSLIVPLLAERLDYVGQAASFKKTRTDVVVPERIEFIVQKVRAQAALLGSDPDVFERVFRAIMDNYIAYEDKRWAALHQL